MFYKIGRCMVLAALFGGGAMAASGETGDLTMRATFAGIGKATSVPYGWVDFCKRYSGECNTPDLQPVDINLTPKTLKELDRINKWVNVNIEPVADMDHWGVVDQWDYPTDGKGDCEDYVLLKRKMLMEEGFPRQALLITVVKDEKGEGHAILTVKTNRGELVLDNQESRVLPWTQTGYRFVKRQSQENPNVWVQVGEPVAAPEFTAR
jgi:predicted transglutaminase-like cysteine proteinase